MKQLLRKPFLFAVLLSLPLWIVFNNYIVAICTGLLLAFLLSMLDALLALHIARKRDDGNQNGPESGSGL